MHKNKEENLFSVPTDSICDVQLAPFWLNEGIKRPWHLFANAYYELSEIAFEKLRRKRKWGLYAEQCIYPALFLFRHSIELCFKVIILYSRSLAGSVYKLKNIEDLFNKHSLWELYVIAKREFPDILHKEEGFISDEAEKVLKQLDRIDDKGQAFRYPFDNKKFGVFIKPSMQTSSTYLWNKLELLGSQLFGRLEGLAYWYEQNEDNASSYS
jgi:hypothetical protein